MCSSLAVFVGLSDSDRCSICHDPLDSKQELLENDTELTLVRWDSIARALKDGKHDQLAKRRMRLDCGGGHEFCYGCIASYYLQSGNTIRVRSVVSVDSLTLRGERLPRVIEGRHYPHEAGRVWITRRERVRAVHARCAYAYARSL